MIKQRVPINGLLPFNAMAYGYTRAEMVDLVLYQMRWHADLCKPQTPPRRTDPHFWMARVLADRRYQAARRSARQFLNGQVKAHSRALDRFHNIPDATQPERSTP